ncbi:MAG: glutamate formimidoyltransferase [Rikenellaceae bacterium]
MTKQIIECVPNFSEGVDMQIIEDIAQAIESSKGAKVLNIDPGKATNRTVITFAGEPQAVVEGAFRAVKKASERIDMSKHKGEHPRIGATDVLPLVPIQGISLEETAQLAKDLAQRIFVELRIPIYLYEAAAQKPENRNLAVCREGEYESLEQKIGTSNGPDFGNEEYTDQAHRSGATVLGARDFLVAVNFNLDTQDPAIATAIARDVREKGRTIDTGEWKQNQKGVWVRDPKGKKTGEKITIKGTLKGCKAIGWYIKEYDIAQVSMNITDIQTTPLHKAYEEVAHAAKQRGARVTGTEIIGLVPQRVLTKAGEYFSQGEKLTQEEKIQLAIEKMNLSDLREFDPQQKIIENLL